MIIDKIENANLYTSLSKPIALALKALADTDFSEKADGRYDIDGDNLFYLVQRYETQPFETGRLEAHRKYIDIQFISAGEEILGYCPLENLTIEKPYNAENDVIFYQVPKNVTKVKLFPNYFCILFPADAHLPCRQLTNPSNVTKVVVKVKTK